MAKREDKRHDYAPDSWEPASNALGCPFTLVLALALGLLVGGVWLMLEALG